MYQQDTKTVVVKAGLPITFVLFCIFLVLKLTGHIAWSWFLVCLPLFAVPLALVAIFAGLFMFVSLERVFTVPWRR
jgi:hypothetical protein